MFFVHTVRTEFTVDTVGHAVNEDVHHDSVAEASHKYMSRVAAEARFAAADAKEAARTGISNTPIPDEVWTTYLDGTAGRELRGQRIKEKNLSSNTAKAASKPEPTTGVRETIHK